MLNNNNLQNYMKENLSLYIFTTVLFIMGVIFGAIITHSLSLNQKQELIAYISGFLSDIGNGDWSNSTIIFRQELFSNLKYLVAIWFLGLSIIGMPIIFLIIFMKGFLIGFTISFLISQLKWQGFMFSLVSVVPQNLIIVPVLIIAGVSGTLFSLSLMKGRDKLKTANGQQTFLSYSLLILILGIVLVIATGFETYVSPYLMKVVTKYMIH